MTKRFPQARPSAPCGAGARLAAVLSAALSAFAPSLADAGEVMVVGTPHLQALVPQAGPEHLREVIDRLAAWSPTLVCVEAMPGDRVGQLAAEPGRWGELLSTFALDALRLAPEQQARLSVDGATALRKARELEARPGALPAPERIRLVGLQLAGHEPWSALLVWVGLTESEKADAAAILGRVAVERLEALSASKAEIVSLAIPVAARLGHRRLCLADPFVDEVAVQGLEAELAPRLADPAVAKGLEEADAERDARWKPGEPDGLVRLVGWMNSAGWAEADRRTQWELFARGDGTSRAGRRRLALWHARNAEIAAHVYRAVASPEGTRTLLIVGAAHRPFLEAALRAQPWVDVIPAERVVPAAGR